MRFLFWSMLALTAGVPTVAAGDIELIFPLSNGTSITREYDTFSTNGRIVGGELAAAGTYPWFARGTRNNHAGWAGCGGSLITHECGLTAAHGGAR